jgi:hypothetical protein
MHEVPDRALELPEGGHVVDAPLAAVVLAGAEKGWIISRQGRCGPGAG